MPKNPLMYISTVKTEMSSIKIQGGDAVDGVMKMSRQ